MKLVDLIAKLDQWHPPHLAEEWDNVGLLLGDRQADVTSVMTCLTVTPESATEAIDKQANLIVSHHPIFFRPIQKLTADAPGGYLWNLARTGVAVYSPHTAFDGAEDGINQQIGRRIGLSGMRPLQPALEPEHFKLVVFVPEFDLANVQQAMFAAGAGRIGEYSECSYRVSGTGTFLGSEASNPTIGERGRREEVAEHRLEVLVAAGRLNAVVSAMRQAHSYEEPAFDIYPLHRLSGQIGAGRCGELERPLPLEQLARRTAQQLGVDYVEFIGDPDKRCRRVAIGCGAGADFLSDAGKSQCDVLITGEGRFHQYLQAREQNVGLILVGHYASERFAVESLADRLAGEFPELQVWPSESEQDPVHRIRL